MKNAQPQKEVLRLDMMGIHRYQKNRYPFLMIDMAEEVIPGESAKGYKNLSANEWFFECHWEGDPSMPGMLQVEALIQLGALALFTLPGNEGTVAYVTSATNIKLLKKVVPGDRLDLDTKVLSFKRGLAQCCGKGTINGELACQAEFTLVLPEILKNFRIVTDE